MQEKILYINIPFFLSSVELLFNRTLKDRALIFTPSDSLYSTVMDVSEAAYREGICRGMTVMEARSLVNNLLLIRPDPKKYLTVLNSLERIINAFTPSYEILPSGEAYLDIRGTEKASGSAEDIAIKIFKEIHSSLNLRGQIGIGSNKLISKAAASFFNNEALIKVLYGNEKRFIAPMSVRILPATDEDILKKFYDYNIFRVGDINRFTQEQLFTIFGRFGSILELWGNGIDIRPIITKDPPFIHEEVVISYEDNDYRKLLQKIFNLASQIGFYLRGRRLLSQRFRLAIVYTDNLSTDGYTGIRTGINTDLSIYRLLKNLFFRIRRRRTNIKKVIAEASLFSPVFIQQELISLPQSRETRLFSAIDIIRERFGKGSIRFGMEEDI